MSTKWWRAILPPNDTRFDEIAPKYFFMTKNEAKKLSKEDFLNMISYKTPVVERVKLTIFIRNYWPFEEYDSSEDDDDDDDNNNGVDRSMKDYVITSFNFEMAEYRLSKETGHWRLNEIVNSKLFLMRDRNHLTLEIISCFPSFPSFDFVKSIDLSGCSLMNEDIPDIAIVVDRCKNLTSLDISNNRISGRCNAKPDVVVYSSIVSWLEKLTLLNISITPLASMESIDLFESFPDEFFKRLIFVPKNWLPGDRWKALCQVTDVTNSETRTNIDTRLEIALGTHNNYYMLSKDK